MHITFSTQTKTALVLVAFCLLIANTTFAQTEETTFAEDQTTTRETAVENRADTAADREEAQTERAEAREEAQERRVEAREEIQAEIQERRDERRAELTERGKERITNLAANISNRMDAAIMRMQNVIDRIESRMEKLAENGLDVTEAERILASAQTSLNAAAADIATIDIDVNAAVTADDPREAWQVVKVKYQAIRDQLRTAHTEIKAAVQALKDAAAETQTTQVLENDEDQTPATSETEIDTQVE